MTENRGKDINEWISWINERIRIIESIIGDMEINDMGDEIRTVKRIIDGDPSLNVPPLYDMIGQLNKSVSRLKSYQEKDQEYHKNMKTIITGLVTMHIITLILAIIGVGT